MNKILTGVGIAGGIVSIGVGLLEGVKTIGEMKNGVKLRQDQLQSVTDAISTNLINFFDYDKLAESVVNEQLRKRLESKKKGE